MLKKILQLLDKPGLVTAVWGNQAICYTYTDNMNLIPSTNYIYGVSIINILGHTEAPGILQIITAKAVGSRLGTLGVPLQLAGPPGAGRATSPAAEKWCSQVKGMGTTSFSLSATSPSKTISKFTYS